MATARTEHLAAAATVMSSNDQIELGRTAHAGRRLVVRYPVRLNVADRIREQIVDVRADLVAQVVAVVAGVHGLTALERVVVK